MSTTEDDVVEDDETFTVWLSVPSGVTANVGTGTINDDEAPSVNLSVNPASVAEDAGATQVTVTGTFSNSSTYATDTTVTVSVGDGSDSATSGTDYAAVTPFTVTIPAGASSGSASFTLAPINDTLAEGDETISVDGAATDLTVNGTSLTLTDDDTAIDLSVTPARVAEDAGATPVTVTATFSNAVTYDTATTVTVTVGDGSDSATAGVDYPNFTTPFAIPFQIKQL